MEVLRRIVLLFLFVVTVNKALAITTITDKNFATAVEICLGTNPVDGLCSSSEYGSMIDWDTSLVTDMKGVVDFSGELINFSGKTSFNCDISRWNTSQVTNMKGMFVLASSFNQHIGNWDTSRVTDMSYMFACCTLFAGDISAWDTPQAVLKTRGFLDARRGSMRAEISIS